MVVPDAATRAPRHSGSRHAPTHDTPSHPTHYRREEQAAWVSVRVARRLMRACLEMWANGTLVFEPLVNLGNRASTWRDGRNAFFIDGWCDHCVTRPRPVGRQSGTRSPEFHLLHTPMVGPH